MIRPVLHLLLGLPAIVGCARALPAQEPTPTDDVRRLAEACNRFGESLYGQLTTSGNPTCSPASICAALYMLLPGADGETADELARALRLPDDLRGARLLAAASHLMPEADGTLRVRNDLWIQEGSPLVPDYTQLLQRHLGATARTVDFANAMEAARRTINDYISDATNERIEELLLPDDLTPDTRTVLTNALWFKAAWREAFRERATESLPFHLANGERVDVPTMLQTTEHGYAEGDGWRCVAMAFDEGPLRFEAIVPAPGKTIDDARRALTSGTYLTELERQRVSVKLPRFKVKARHSLRDALQAMGVHAAWQPGKADFSRMDTSGQLVVSDVVHETWIAVDEKGCEAAAATAVLMKRGAAARPEQPKEIVFDRPFVFGLRDPKTGLLWFVGEVDNPLQQP